MTDDVDAQMAELMRSSMQLDVEIRTVMILYIAALSALLLAVWVFTGSHVAMLVFAAFAAINVREIGRVNDLAGRLRNCDFGLVMSMVTHQLVVRWAYDVTAFAEGRAK